MAHRCDCGAAYANVGLAHACAGRDHKPSRIRTFILCGEEIVDVAFLVKAAIAHLPRVRNEWLDLEKRLEGAAGEARGVKS